jgi:chromosome segregation ATPase
MGWYYLGRKMDDTSNEHFLPELQSIQSDVEYLKHLRKRLWDVEHRISQAVEAIPALEKEIPEEEEARNVSSAALATLLSTSERVSALATVTPRNQFVQSHLAPATAARSSASSTLAELISYHAAIPGKLNSLRASLETARGVVHAGDAAHARLQAILHATVAAIKAKYELVHPVHRLPRALLSRIFALVVSEEYAAAVATVTSGKEARTLVSPTRLSLVCYLWRDIAYAAESLWNRILITASSLRRHSAP